MVSVNSVSSIDYKNNTAVKTKQAGADGATFESFLGESISLDKIFDQAAEKYNVPVELLKAIGKQESNFNTKAVSSSGAQGVMQLMPGTAKELGVTDPFDAEQNIMGGSKYIAEMLKKYDGDVKLALAAYNAGAGNVKKYGGIPPFEETQNYVKKVTAYMQGKDPSGPANVSATVNTAENSNPINAIPTFEEAAEVKEPHEINLTVDGSLSSIDNIFTYDDYLNFIEKLMQEQKEEDAEENSALYAAKQINYNIPVMNLLTGSNL